MVEPIFFYREHPNFRMLPKNNATSVQQEKIGEEKTKVGEVGSNECPAFFVVGIRYTYYIDSLCLTLIDQ